MLTLTKKIGAGLASAVMASFVFAGGVYADTSVNVGGNGAFSENNVQTQTNSNVNVEQTNRTDVRTAVVNAANTGGVAASFNTGSDVDVRTGDATAETTVNVDAGQNVLDLSGCDTCGGNTDIDVTGNGAFSENYVGVENNNNVDVRQETRTRVMSDIVNAANTGGVVGSFNTGSDVTVRTGDATATTNVTVEGGDNRADLGVCCGGSETDVDVHGNGAFSINDVEVQNNSNLNVDQDSDTNVDTEVVNLANTGLAATLSSEGFGGFGHSGHGDYGKRGGDYGKDFGKHDSRSCGCIDHSKGFGGKGHDFTSNYNDWGHNFKNKKFGGFDHDRKYARDMYNDFHNKKRYMLGTYDNNYLGYRNKMYDNNYDDYNRRKEHLNWWHNFGNFGGNTGSSLDIRTGDADSAVNVDVSGGSNRI